MILVGEIRDLETAQIAVEASLTGHLVFSTLHTNDAPLAITRLLDLGDRAVPVSATRRGDRRAAPRAHDLPRVPGRATTRAPRCCVELELRPEHVAGKRFAYGKGCARCNGTGYKGRMAIFEILRDHGAAAADGHRRRVLRRAPRRRRAARACAPCASRACSRSSTA